MNAGRILVCGVVLLAANAAYAEGKYERALDGKTKVWHNPAQRHVEASWSGDRDDKGYATGRGTLTFYRVERSWETGSLLPSTKYIAVSRYTGKMVDGKLEGSVVSVDARGDTYHARFADGEKSGDWVSGPPPSSKKKTEKKTEQLAERGKLVEPPAEGPPPAPKLDQHVAERPAEPAAEQPKVAQAETKSAPVPAKPEAKKGPTAKPKEVAAEQKQTAQAEESLQSLTRPPSSLRVASLETSQQPATARTDAEAAAPTEAAAPSAPPSSPSISMNDDDARAVAALDSEYQAAVKTNDAKTIDRILADDFVLVAPGKTLSKADLLKQAREKQAKYERHEIEEGSQKVRVWRDTAVVTETLWVKGAENGKPVDEKMPVTETYVRTPSGWRYVSGQASTPTSK